MSYFIQPAPPGRYFLPPGILPQPPRRNLSPALFSHDTIWRDHHGIIWRVTGIFFPSGNINMSRLLRFNRSALLISSTFNTTGTHPSFVNSFVYHVADLIPAPPGKPCSLKIPTRQFVISLFDITAHATKHKVAINTIAFVCIGVYLLKIILPITSCLWQGSLWHSLASNFAMVSH